MEQPTNGELNLMLKNTLEKIDRLGDHSKEEYKSVKGSIDSVDKKMDRVMISVAEMTKTLSEHDKKISEIESETKLLMKHRNWLWGAVSTVMALAAILGLIAKTLFIGAASEAISSNTIVQTDSLKIEQLTKDVDFLKTLVTPN